MYKHVNILKIYTVYVCIYMYIKIHNTHIYYLYINTNTCMYIFKKNMLCLYIKYIYI